MTVSHYHNSYGLNVHIIKVAAVAHTDGTFDSKTIDEAVASAGLPKAYYHMGYSLIDAWAVNPAATHPTAGAVTITDSTARPLLGNSGSYTDTLTLSTSASGVSGLAVERPSGQRTIISPLTIAVSDTGAAANTFTLYIVMGK